MQTLYFLGLLIATASLPVLGQDLQLLIDAPGPEYRKMRGNIDIQSLRSFSVSATILSFEPTDTIAAEVVPIDGEMSQIRLLIRPESNQKIKDYIEFNIEKSIRIEIGGYTLPIDIKRTFPWTDSLWLQESVIDTFHLNEGS